MPKLQYGNVASDQLYLVRVQAGLEGTQVDGGDLLITRTHETVSENSMRNTVHFTLNGVVSNHAYSEFNHLFVFVSPLEQTNEKNKGLLAGLNPSDTFFHQNANDNLRLHQPTLVAPNGAEIPAHILDSGINVVRYDAPEVINGKTLQATRDIAVGNVLKELGAPVNKIGMWGWSDTPDPTPEQRNALIESLGYDKEHIATVHNGSPEEEIEALIGRYVYHNNRILNGERLDTLDSGLQIPHIEQITQNRQSILSTIEKMPNEEVRQKMTDRFNQIDQRFQQKLADYEAANTQQFGTINNFDDDDDFEFTGFNSPSSDQLDNDIGMVQPPPLPEEVKVSVPPPLPQDYLDSLDARYEDVGIPMPDQSLVSQSNSVPPPLPVQEEEPNMAMENQDRENGNVQPQSAPQDYDPFWDVGIQDPVEPSNYDFEMGNQDFGEPPPGQSSFEGFDEAYMSQINSQPEPNDIGVQPMAETQNDSVFEGTTVDLNSLTPNYLLHPTRTMAEIHQAFDSFAQAPAAQVKAHFDKWKKQDIEELNNLVTNDARALFDQELNTHNAGKSLNEAKFPTLSGAWYNSPNGSDAALKGLDSNAFQRVPVVAFQSINPKTRELQEVTRYAMQAVDPAHPDVAKFIDARQAMVNDKVVKNTATNALKKTDLDNLIATAPENGIYLGIAKEGLPLKSALNVVQHPSIAGRAEEVKLGEDNEIAVAPDGLSFNETPREVYGIRGTDPEHPVTVEELEAAENDRKRDFAVGITEGLDISKPELDDKEPEQDPAKAPENAVKPKAEVDSENKVEEKPAVKKPNGRNNFKKNTGPGVDTGMASNFAGNGGQGGQKTKGNNSKDLTDDLEEQPRKPRKAGSTEIETPSARYLVEQLLQAAQKAFLAILKMLAKLLKFLFNGAKAGYFAGKAALLGHKGLDNFDAKMKRDNAIMKTLDTLSFDRTKNTKSKNNGKGIAVANLPNSLGDKDPEKSISAQLDKLNAKFAEGTGRKYDTFAASITDGKVVPVEPVNDVQLAEFDKLAGTDTMFTTKNGERFVILGDAPTEEGDKPKYEVIKLSDSTIIPIERNSPDFQRHVVSVYKDEVADQLEAVAYDSKVLSPDVATNRNDYKSKPDAFFKKYPDEKEKLITTDKAVLEDRIGRLLQHKDTGMPHVIVGVDTFARKDGSRAVTYQTVEMTTDTPADLNFLRDAKIHTTKPTDFAKNSLSASDVLDPKLKDRLVDLQMNGFEIQRNGIGLDLADLKTLGASFLELSKSGIHRLTSSELDHVINTLDDLAKIHPNVTASSNEIKFDPAAVQEKLQEKEAVYIQEYLSKQNIDINDPSIKQGINSRIGFFGKQPRPKLTPLDTPLDTPIPTLSADQEVVAPTIKSNKPDQKAVFNLDNDGIGYAAPVVAAAVPVMTNAAPGPIDIDPDVNVANDTFIQSNDTSLNFTDETFIGPLPQEIEFKDIAINPHNQVFVQAYDNSIDYDREYDGVKAFEMPEFEPKDQTNEAFINDVWNDSPRGAINEQVQSKEVELIQVPDFKFEIPQAEAPQVTDATFDNFLKDFNAANPVEAVAPAVEAKKEAEIDWGVDALKLDLADLAKQNFAPESSVNTPEISYSTEDLFNQLLEEQPEVVAAEPAEVQPVMLTPEQEMILDNAVEDMKARIEVDKQEMLMELEQEAQALQVEEPNLDTVAHIVEQQEAAIQKEMGRGPRTVITGEAVPVKLNFSLSEISTMPTMGTSDLIANIRSPNFAEQMQLKTLSTFAARNPDVQTLTADELKAATEHVRLSDTSNLLRLHRDEVNSSGYEQSALFAPGLRSINGVEGDQSLMARRNRHEPFEALKERILHELEASDNHPATVKMCEQVLQTRINSDVTKLGRACEAVGLSLNKSFTQSNNFENVAQFRETFKSQFPDTDLKINDLVLNDKTGDMMTVVGRRLEDIENNGVSSKAERLLVAKASAIGLVGTPEAIDPADVKLAAEAGGRLTNRQIERFENLNLNDINGLDIKSAPSKLDLSHNAELDGAKNNILAMLTNPQEHPDDSLACELQDMRDSLNQDRDRFFEIQREVMHNPAVVQFMANVQERLAESKMDASLISIVLPVQNEQGALLKYENVVNFDTLNMLREMNSTNKADENGFYKQTDFAKVLIEANDPKLNAQVAELGRVSRNIADTMGSIDEIRAEMVTQVFNDAENQGNFTKEDITRLHQQVTNDTISTRESLPAILGSVAQYSEVANTIEQNRNNPTPMTNEEIVNEGKGKFGKFLDKVSSMFKRSDNEQEEAITAKSNDLFAPKAEVKVKVEVEKDKRRDNNNDSALSM